MGRQAVRAPIPQAPRYGLLIAAPTIDGEDERVLMGGWEFLRYKCTTGNRTAVRCRSNTTAMAEEALDSDGIQVGDPLLVFTNYECTTRGFAVADYEVRARNQLASIVSFEVANELWTGTTRDSVGDPDVIDNAALTDIGSDTVTNGPVSAHDALGLLTSALGTCLRGGRGMIHVTPHVLTAMIQENALYRDGNLWLSPMGHIVVADDGYDGSGPGGVPAGATQWAYATSMISIRTGPVIVPGDFESWVDRTVNRVVVYAEQAYGFQFDGCCMLAAEVALPAPLIGPPS